jgi:MFS transporter, ACS family, hexuronate transporter
VDASPALLRYRWVALAMAFTAQWSNALVAQAVPPLAPLFQPELGLTKSEVGIFASVTFAGSWVVLILSGSLSDRVGVRKMLFAGQMLMAAPMLMMAVAGSFLHGVVIMFLAGLGRGTILPASTKAIMDWFPPSTRATAMGLKQTGMPVAGLITALALPAIGLTLGWRYAVALVGLLIIAGGIATGLLYRDVVRPAQTSGRGTGLRAELGGLVRNANVWIIGLVSILFVTTQLSFITYLPLYLKEVVLLPFVPDEAARIVAAGGYLGVAHAGGIFGRVFWGVVSDRLFGGRRMLVLALVAAICAVALFALAQAGAGYPLWVLTILAFALGASAIGWNGIHQTAMVEVAGRARAATGVGLMMSLSQVGLVGGPPLFGLIVDVSGLYQTGWLTLTGLAAVAAVVCFLATSRERHVD